MDFEKTIDSINGSKDLFESFLNFLDIKFTKQSEEKLTHLFNNLFQSFNNLTYSEDLQKRGVEKLSLKFYKISQNFDNEKSFSEKFSNNENSKISKILNSDETMRSSDRKKLFDPLDKSTKSLGNNQAKQKSEPNKKNAFEFSKAVLSKNPKFSDSQIKLALSFVKIAEKKFSNNSVFDNPKELVDKRALEGIVRNSSLNESFNDALKLNLKLFNESLSHALKGQFDLFQTRLIEQPPFGIVAFYIKEKEKKNFIKTSKEKRKKRLSKKQEKYQNESSI